jgi:hypothetical protein
LETQIAEIPDEGAGFGNPWMKSWGMLERTDSALDLVDMDMQARAQALV